MSTVDRSQWWVALDGYDEPCVWAPVPDSNPWPLLRSHGVDPIVWAYVTEGLPDRGDCPDCTAVPCPAHDSPGVVIPLEDAL